tara:strand:- start:720 stop:899 length:180 start_codon:yes stop_codon:yes gene_type:complete
MELAYKLLLSEKERDLLIDLIEHRVFLINSRIDNGDLRHNKSSDNQELNMLHKIGDRLT